MKNKKYILIIIIVLFLTLTGISYAWFSQQMGLSTLMTIIPPDYIDIVPIGSDGKDATMLDLEFQEGDQKNEENGEITIRRLIYVYSTSPVHQLEIAHTTNLNKLTVSIYAATENENGSFSYNANNPLTGKFANKKNDDSSLAKEENLHNYKEGDSVEEHAYPLYWIAGYSGDHEFVADTDEPLIVNKVTSIKLNEYDPVKQVNKNYYKTYYYLEITWQENSKETDLFYIMAQNIAVTEQQVEGG